jgi:D-alanyl-D-alanine carboxypeptidase (penicillin-binding protein 5/6)
MKILLKSVKFLALALCFLCIELKALAYETKAKQAILMDADTGEVLFSLRGDEKMAPSSMSKIMTAYIVFDYLKKGRLKLDDSFPASEKAWSKKGSSMFIPVGRFVAVKDLLLGLIVQSGNDAAIILAEAISGTEEEFSLLMNDYAKRMGLTNSNFVNATGWPDPDHYMSCRDLAIVADRTIRDFPEEYQFYKILEFTYNNITQYNRNTLLLKDSSIDGLKTGHTELGGYGLVASGSKNQRRLIAVVNGLSTDKSRLTEAEGLLNYGFANFKNAVIALANQPFLDVAVHGSDIRMAKVATHKDAILPIASHLSDKLKVVYKLKTPLIAPITRDTEVGELIIEKPEKGGQLVYKLYPSHDIEGLPFYKRFWYNLANLF